MKTEIVKLTQIKVNGANPRTITDEKFDKLINLSLIHISEDVRTAPDSC